MRNPYPTRHRYSTSTGTSLLTRVYKEATPTALVLLYRGQHLYACLRGPSPFDESSSSILQVLRLVRVRPSRLGLHRQLNELDVESWSASLLVTFIANSLH